MITYAYENGMNYFDTALAIAAETAKPHSVTP